MPIISMFYGVIIRMYSAANYYPYITKIAKLLLVIINHRLSIRKCFDIDNRHYI